MVGIKRAWIAAAIVLFASQIASEAGGGTAPCGHPEHALAGPWFHTGETSAPVPVVFRVEPLVAAAAESLPRVSSEAVVRRAHLRILPSLDDVRTVENWNFEALMTPRDETPYEVRPIERREPRESREFLESLTLDGRERRELNAYGLSTDLWGRFAMDAIAPPANACDR